MEGARKSVQMHKIGSMCVTALPTQISLVVTRPQLNFTSQFKARNATQDYLAPIQYIYCKG